MTSSWEHTLLGPVTALGERVFAILPNVLAMMILLLVGLGAAWGMGHLMERLLRVIGLDRLCDRIGIAGALLRGGIKADPSYIIGRITYWLIVIFATTASLGALDVAPINEAAHSLLSYIPHLVTAAVIGIVIAVSRPMPYHASVGDRAAHACAQLNPGNGCVAG